MKKWFSLLTICMICCSIHSAFATNQISLYSQYAYLVDPQTHIVYFDQKSEEQIYPASMTKIMTVALSLEKIDDLKKEVNIETIDLDGLYEMGASVAGLMVGERVTYEDLLYGALLPSGADACNALARLTYGSQDAFVKAMNLKVQKLGLKHTHFANTTGLHDDNHYTTAKEMSQILEWALENPDFQTIFETRQYTTSFNTHTWVSTLARAQSSTQLDTTVLDGAKSGFTDEAQLTLASTMTIDNHQLILVTAYAQGQRSFNNVKDALHIYENMKENYHNLTVYHKGDDIYQFYILKTTYMPYHYRAQEDISLLVEQHISMSDLEINVQGDQLQIAPLQMKSEIGHIDVSYQNQQLMSYSLNLYENIEVNQTLMMIIYGVIACFFVILISKIMISKRKNHNHS